MQPIWFYFVICLNMMLSSRNLNQIGRNEKCYFKMVPGNLSFYLPVVFCGTLYSWKFWTGRIFGTLARDNIIICVSNQTRKNNMNIGFILIGAVIFAVYLGLMILNIVYSSKKQQEENYPNVDLDEPADDSEIN